MNLDAPLLGLHPGIIVSGVTSLFRKKPDQPPAVIAQPSFGRDPNLNAPFPNDIVMKDRGWWKNIVHFVKKHNSEGLVDAATRHIMSHLEFGSCLMDLHALKLRYMILRELDNIDSTKHYSSPHTTSPRVRFAQYYTVCHGYPKIEAPDPEIEVPRLDTPTEDLTPVDPDVCSTCETPLEHSENHSHLGPPDGTGDTKPAEPQNYNRYRYSLFYALPIQDECHFKPVSRSPLVRPHSARHMRATLLDIYPSDLDPPEESRRPASLIIHDISDPRRQPALGLGDREWRTRWMSTDEGLRDTFPDTFPKALSEQCKSNQDVFREAAGAYSLRQGAPLELAPLGYGRQWPRLPDPPEVRWYGPADPVPDKDTQKRIDKELKKQQDAFHKEIKAYIKALKKGARAATRPGKKPAEVAEAAQAPEQAPEQSMDRPQILLQDLQSKKGKKGGPLFRTPENEEEFTAAFGEWRLAQRAMYKRMYLAMRKYGWEVREAREDVTKELEAFLEKELASKEALATSGAAAVMKSSYAASSSDAPLVDGKSSDKRGDKAKAKAKAKAKEEQKPGKPPKNRKFCNLPAKTAGGQRDPLWIDVFMKDVDEVAAHTGLFFQGPHYESLVCDVGQTIVGWVQDDLTARAIAGMEQPGAAHPVLESVRVE